LDIVAEVWSFEGDVELRLVAQEGQIAKKRGGGGVGWSAWAKEGRGRVHVNREWRGRFHNDAGKRRM